MQADMTPSAAATRGWWAPLAAVASGGVALAVALLVPRLYSDPVGVDPYLLRVGAVSLALVAAVWRPAGLRAARGVLLALAAVCVPFSSWLATPAICRSLFGAWMSFPAQLAVAGAVQVALVGLFAACTLRLPVAERPPIRLRTVGRAAVFASAAGVAALLIVVMLLPARWLGREALQPVMLARDGGWLVVAGSLQAAGQEVAFRGMLLGALERGVPARLANVTQAAFFGFAHLAVQYEGPAGPFVPVTIALGLLLGWLTLRTDSLWPAIIIHSVADIAVALAVVDGLYGY